MLSRFTNTELFMMAGPLIMFVIVLEMVRRDRLREDYSLLWLGTFAVLFFLPLFRSTLDQIAALMGIVYAPSAWFVIGFAMLLVVLLQFSSVITKLSRENKQAAQHIALLSNRLAELEAQLNAAD